MNDRAEIRLNKSYRSIVVEAGGLENVPFLQKDCRNFLNKVHRLRLGEGDFFYVMDLYMKKGRFISWVDAKSRDAYVEIGDVITFGTTF
ncbi:hypothetical protein DCAR_0830408 [Daucus carota subsp. sativus]|uniref:Uncharacterized protein n=1 Tax=Daucus carota subsp. sativus TaxID=79200 RepID=A0AAF0XMP2_DAUCS|nr:hypothetical protein DCAR_0830408 [Daucus carota subsp. sativus]